MNYEDGMDAIADVYIDEVLGVEASDVLNPLASLFSAGGEIAKGFAQKSEQEKALAAERTNLLNAGEAAWGRMKRAAEAARWPQDISPRVVLSDKTWQASKHTADAETMKRLIGEMNDLAQQLEMRLGGMPPGAPGAYPPGYYPPAPTGMPLWAKILLGGLIAGGAVMGVRAMRRTG